MSYYCYIDPTFKGRVLLLRICAAILFTFGLAGAAMAVTVCYPRDQMMNYIARDFAATKLADGVLRPHSVMEVWVSEHSGDWLVVTTDLNGSSCIVAYGERFNLASIQSSQPSLAIPEPRASETQ